MNKININGVAQYANCDQLDAIAHDYLGVQTSLDDESYGCRAGADLSLPSTINATDGVYSDTKEAFAALSPKVTVSGTEYVRILDDAVMTVLNNNGVGSEGKITPSQFASITSLNSWFQGNTDIVYVDFSALENLVVSQNMFTGCTNLKVAKFGCIDWTQPEWYGAQFQNCSNLEEFSVNSAINCYRLSTFQGCTKLKKVTFGNATQLFNSVFSNGDPDGEFTRYIRHPFFYGGVTLYFLDKPNTPLGTLTTPLRIPSTISTINAYALYNLQSCVNLHYQGTVAEWLSVTKGTSWHYNIGTDFIQCTDGKAGLDDTTSTGNTTDDADTDTTGGTSDNPNEGA